MTVETWRHLARAQLVQSGDLDADWDADFMLCEALSCERSRLRWLRESELDAQSIKRLKVWLEMRCSGEPLQYILGKTCFMGLTIHCDKRALIPRQDTETLAEWALQRMKTRVRPRVLDLCTGTGAIGLSVRHARPDASVTMSDISAEALSLARENARALGLEVSLCQGDLFDAVRGEKFDFILCNPPYLSMHDMDHLMREVRQEPKLALFGGADGLDFYRRIAAEMNDHLMLAGEVLLEVGMGQHDSVMNLLREEGFCTCSRRDLCGVERVVMGFRE